MKQPDEHEFAFMAGGGAMGALMRGHDWSASPLGEPASWSPSLRAAVSIMLNSRFPIALYWGPQLALVYNDAWSPIPGTKHPWALGRPGREVWPEIWDTIGPLYESVFATGEGVWQEDELLPMLRHGYVEECYFNFTFSPVRGDTGQIDGIFNAVVETTDRVISERRLRTLSRMGERPDATLTLEAACQSAVDILSGNAADAPFALVYLRNDGEARLVASAGLASRPDLAPPVIRLASDTASIWPLGDIDGDGVLAAPMGVHLIGPVWPEPVSQVSVTPIKAPGGVSTAFLVVGVNPRRVLDANYKSFLEVAAGHVGNAIASARAYDEERRRAEALAELDRAKTQFFSNVSHEFRTPLTLMLGPLEQLLSNPDLDTVAVREPVETARRNATRLLKMVNTLLDFSSMEAGRIEARFSPVDLAAYTAEIASAFRSLFEQAQLTFEIEAHSLGQAVYIDRDLWEKVVLNLISNAFKFTLEGGVKVTVRQAPGGDGAEVIVADTGVGIPQAELPRLFERFYRVESAQGRSYEGSGIGLALVRGLVDLHGGAITVESREGAGTTFTVRLPFGARHLPADRVREIDALETDGARRAVFLNESAGWLAPSSAIVSGGPRETHAGRGRVLLADDNADMRQYVTRLLVEEGYEVEAANDGESALSLALRRPPDLVLTDVMMPRLDGLSLLRALRADPATKETPVILLSARAGEEAKVEGLDAGADDYLVKPFSARELVARVQSAIRLAEARREADRALREESLRVLRLLEQAPSFICVLRGPDHVFEFANAAYRRIVGQREVIGRSVRDAVPEAVEQGFLDLLDRAYAGERVAGEAAYMRLDPGPDGQPVDCLVDFIYEPIAEADGSISGVFVEGYDVTDRVSAEQALRRSEEQLRLATEAAEVGLWDVDGMTGALYWPASVKAMFGISPEKPVTMDDFYAGLHPDDRDATSAAYQAAADPNRRALYDVEFRTIGKEDGEVRWIAAKGRGLFDDDGRCLRVIGTAIDITRRKIDEARLRELNETLERRVSEALAERKVLADIVEGTDAFVQVVDLDYRWLAINKASTDEFERIFGKRPRAGDNMLDTLADRPEHAAAVKAVWSRALAGEEFTQIEEFGDPGRGRRAYEMKFNTLRDQAGRQIGVYQFVYDVTERLRDQARLAEAEAALRQAQKLDAMGQLTGGVAHDFNNLLTPIIGALDTLQRRRVGSEREQRLVAGALQSGERAKTLVQRLLAFARRQPLQATAVDIRTVIGGMADLIASTIGPQIRVILAVDPDLPPARADANQLEMAILNLSVNARDAMEQGGTLRISADVQEVAALHDAKLKPGRYVRVAVADTGAGMSKEVVEKAIEPFFSTKGIGKGTGLGLSMVHGLTTQLGGGLVIESLPGQGTTVELWLPASDGESYAPLPRAVSATKSHPLPLAVGRALVVDDEDLVRASAVDMLTELGFDILEASSAEEALKILEHDPGVDILITDHLMPGMSGAALANAVRDRWPGIRTVIISGYADAEGIGTDLVRLNKPFRQSEIAEVLTELDPGFRPLARSSGRGA